MRRSRLRRRLGLLLVLALTAATCASSDDSPTTTTQAGAPSSTSEGDVAAPADADIKLGPVETAAALSDPATAEQGVWSVLANLGLGVYTGDGEQVLGGSETSEEDFWLYDFEIPALVRTANAEPTSFAVKRPGRISWL